MRKLYMRGAFAPAKRRGRTACRIATATCALCAAGTLAHADLRIDLRATAVNGVPISGAQTTHLIPNAVAGDVIAFDIYALVTGTNANFLDDRVIIDAGSFKSSQVGAANLLGSLDADVVRSVYDSDGELIFLGFDNTGFSVGDRADLDGDSDIDVGSNDPSEPSPHWVIVYDIGTFVGSPAGLPNGRRVGFGAFTVLSAPAGSQTLINFFGRNAAPATAYRQDGVLMNGPALDSPPEFGVLVASIPEPTATALLAVSGLSFRRRRR